MPFLLTVKSYMIVKIYITTLKRSKKILGPLNMTKLANDESVELTRPITETEIKESLLKLNITSLLESMAYPGNIKKTCVHELTPVLSILCTRNGRYAYD